LFLLCRGFCDSIAESPVSADELVQRIHAECRSRGVTLGQFEDVVGWRLSACIEPPEHLLEDMTQRYLWLRKAELPPMKNGGSDRLRLCICLNGSQ